MNFKNPNLWIAVSGIVATIALVLSQFPPIRQMIRGTDVRVSTPEEIYLWHDLGKIGVSVSLDIYNAGGYSVNISKVECAILENDTGKVFNLPARTYRTENGYSLSLGTITLSPDQHWTHDVACFNSFTRAELEQVNDLKSRIRADIVDKQDKLPAQDRDYTWIVLDNKLYQEAVNFFKQKFELTHEGSYRFFIKVTSDSGETLKVQGFDFTLYKSNIQGLKGIAERDYKFGAGIDSANRYTRGGVTIPITTISESDSRIVYQQKVANR